MVVVQADSVSNVERGMSNVTELAAANVSDEDLDQGLDYTKHLGDFSFL